MKKKILVIDDSTMNRKLALHALEMHGYEVLEAETGEAGLERAKADCPDLILMDIQMPGIDGISALAQIRKTPSLETIPVFAVTAYAMRGDKEKFLDEGFDAYIAKPVSIDLLLEEVKKAFC